MRCKKADEIDEDWTDIDRNLTERPKNVFMTKCVVGKATGGDDESDKEEVDVGVKLPIQTKRL